MRNETEYRNVTSKSGKYSPHISQKVNKRLSRYCEIKNINKTKFVERVITEALNKLEEDMLKDMTREDLEQIILSKWSE